MLSLPLCEFRVGLYKKNKMVFMEFNGYVMEFNAFITILNVVVVYFGVLKIR